MPAQWTGDLVGKMHCHCISNKRLAQELGCTQEYISMVLNGHREPPGAEERFNKAVQEIIESKSV